MQDDGWAGCELGSGGFDVPRLIALLEQHRPQAIAFNGKKAPQIVLERNVDYGRQHERIAGVRVFVLPRHQELRAASGTCVAGKNPPLP